MGTSPETAAWVSDWANVVLIVSLIVGVVSTYLVVISGNVKEADLKRQVAVANAEAARANESGAELKLQAAGLERETAKANEAAATANQRAAELALALEKERAARLPRTVSAEQAGALASLLKDVPKGPVYVVPDWVDAEAKLFAAQIERVLRDIGYSVGPLTDPGKPLSYGKLGAFFVIRDRNALPEHLAPLYNGFKRIGFDFVIYEEKYVPPHGVMIGVSTK